MSNVGLGASFERYVSKCLGFKNWNIVRIADGCVVYGPNRLQRVKQAFDFIGTRHGKLAIYFDTKTVQGSTFRHSAIDPNQLKKLSKIEQDGHVAGFIIHFRQVDKYCFASAALLSSICPNESVKPLMCVDLGKEIDISILF